eukprot:gene14071-biopygen14149
MSHFQRAFHCAYNLDSGIVCSKYLQLTKKILLGAGLFRGGWGGCISPKIAAGVRWCSAPLRAGSSHGVLPVVLPGVTAGSTTVACTLLRAAHPTTDVWASVIGI